MGPDNKEQADYYCFFKSNWVPISAISSLINLDRSFTIKKVIFNDPATIVFWSDGEKTVVKCYNEQFDPEKGLAMAICKRVYGSEFHRIFRNATAQYYINSTDPDSLIEDNFWIDKIKNVFSRKDV